MNNKLPDVDYLNECFTLVDGDLYWKVRPRNHFETERGHATFNGKNAHKKAGSTNRTTGHTIITLNRKKVMASRVIMKIFYGIESTTLFIVHRDGNRLNNHPHNLTLENRGTSLSCRKNPKRTRGVCWNHALQKWIARVGDARNPKWSDMFDDIEMACEAAAMAREKFYGTYKGVR